MVRGARRAKGEAREEREERKGKHERNERSETEEHMGVAPTCLACSELLGAIVNCSDVFWALWAGLARPWLACIWLTGP